jgi:8-oxo-dGTP diphosphatase
MSKIIVKIKNTKFKSAHVVLFKDGKVLILRRSKTDDWMPGHYGLPGGKLDSGETVTDALSRECKEEVNIVVSPSDFIFLPKVSIENKHAFFCATKFSGEPKLDFEHDDFQWVNPKDLSNYKVVPDLIDIVNAGLEKLFNDV